MNWNLQMYYPCSNREIPCFSIIIARYHYCVLCQRFSRGSCIPDCWIFLKNTKFSLKSKFGFRRLRSSYMALMFMMDKITAAMDNGDYVIGIFLDFSKAFDTVNHDILLEKLCHYGIRGNALEWFKSYLTNRRQFVTYNGMVSKTKCITCGVPRGLFSAPSCSWYI